MHDQSIDGCRYGRERERERALVASYLLSAITLEGVESEQCDQIGLLLESFGKKFSFKSSPNIFLLLC